MFLKSFGKLWTVSISLSLSLSCILAGLFPVSVLADNTEDLLNVYGLTLGGPVKSDLEKEMSSLESDLQSMQVQQNKNEEYNALLEQYIIKQQSLRDSVLSSISTYQSNNDIIKGEIEDNLLTSDIDTLISYDSEYKSNVSHINDLLSALNDSYAVYSYKSLSADLSSVEQQLSEVKSLYVESLDAYDLGDVKDIKWILDNDKYVTSTYGYRVDPLDSSIVKFHAGTDYRATTGTPIGALFNGTILSCGWSDTIGYYVTVQCGENVKYLVCHCSELCVTEGQYVNQYDTIAYSGGTGSRCTGPHLHLALYLNGVTYDVDELFK